MFQRHGFENVTVGDIAAEVGMAESTVFWHFGTKEQIVLWDEHDAALDRDLAHRLRDQRPLSALRDAFIDTLASRYDEDLDFQLERINYIYDTEALHAAAVEADFTSRAELAGALAGTLSKSNRHAASLLAGAALLALDTAIERWQREKARDPLAGHITDAFEALANLESIE